MVPCSNFREDTSKWDHDQGEDSLTRSLSVSASWAPGLSLPNLSPAWRNIWPWASSTPDGGPRSSIIELFRYVSLDF